MVPFSVSPVSIFVFGKKLKFSQIQETSINFKINEIESLIFMHIYINLSHNLCRHNYIITFNHLYL